MTSRKEDELDLKAMEIADKLTPESNLRLPRDAQSALRLLKAVTPEPCPERKDGAV